MGQTRSDHTTTMEKRRNDYCSDPKILRHTGGRLFLLASVLHHVVGGPCHCRSRLVSVRADNHAKRRADVREVTYIVHTRAGSHVEMGTTMNDLYNRLLFEIVQLNNRIIRIVDILISQPNDTLNNRTVDILIIQSNYWYFII